MDSDYILFMEEGCPKGTRMLRGLEAIDSEVSVYILGKNFTREQWVKQNGEDAKLPRLILKR